jgi:transcriptional regulator with XRE-family HTH domain
LLFELYNGGNEIFMDKNVYPNINMEKTGLLLKKKITEQGYSVKDIQKYLQLSCPQPIYRWFKGKVMPSLDHLLMLSRILKVHMEDLLVIEGDSYVQNTEKKICEILPYDMRGKNRYSEPLHKFQEGTRRRMAAYWGKLCVKAA